MGAENVFTKEQLLAAKRFQKRRDMVEALLSPDRQYSVKEAEQMMKNYEKGKVK